MEIYTQIQQKGLITIPMSIRKQFGINPSDLMKIGVVAGKIVLEPVRVLPYPTRRYSEDEVKEFLELDKNEG